MRYGLMAQGLAVSTAGNEKQTGQRAGEPNASAFFIVVFFVTIYVRSRNQREAGR